MVSTRGVKFKFSEGDRVLCYEPDPTKAKVLYESKVLELVLSRDSRGRKVPEYRVHFQGWNSSWDRCVREDFVLEDNPENRILQKKLAHDAAINLKGKKRKRLPAFFKEYMKKGWFDSDGDNESDVDSVDSNLEGEEEDNDDDEEDNEEESDGKHLFSEIKLTENLKEKLEDDCYVITAKNKLVNLPCEPNVIRILEGYVKQTAFNMLYSMPIMKGMRHSQRGNNLSHSSDIETKLNLSKELVDGLRIFFDFTLPLSLLYREEKQQYETINSLVVNATPSPIPSLSCVPPPTIKEDPDEGNGEIKRARTPGEGNGEIKRARTPGEDSIPWHSFQPLSPPPANPGSNVNSQPSSPSFSNAIFNNGQNNHNSLQSIFFQNSKTTNSQGNSTSRTSTRSLNNGGNSTLNYFNDVASSNNGGCLMNNNSINVSGRTRYSSRSQSTIRDRQSPSSSIEDGSMPKRVLRSSDRQREKLKPEPPTVIKSEQNSNDVTPLDLGSGTGSPPVQTKQGCGSQTNTCNTLIMVVSQAFDGNSPSTNLTLPSLSVSSYASSTHSDSTLKTGTVNSNKGVFPSTSRLRDTTGLLNEVLSWQMLPQSIYEAKPVTPSVIYGAQHLLRLFVVLPDYLSRMNMTKRKRNTLVDGLKLFVKYLDDRCGELFPDSATYKDLDELSNPKS